MDLIKLLTGAINAVTDAKAASDAAAQAAALAELDAIIAEVHPAVAGLKAEIEANKTAALAALHDKFKTEPTKPE